MEATQEIELEDKSYIIKLSDGRSVMVHNGKHLNIDTYAGDIHVVEEGNTTTVSLYDHFCLTITGTHKKVPTVTIDSNEYLTNLVIRETEGAWHLLTVERKSSNQPMTGDVQLTALHTAVVNLGELMGLYYQTLRQNGAAKELAYELTLDYQRFTLGRMEDEAG